MSGEPREPLAQALSDLKRYQDKMSQPDQVACLATISFLDEEKFANVKNHRRHLLISGILKNRPTTRVMVDNGSAVNIISPWVLQSLGLTIAHLKPITLVYKALTRLNNEPRKNLYQISL